MNSVQTVLFAVVGCSENVCEHFKHFGHQQHMLTRNEHYGSSVSIIPLLPSKRNLVD